MEKTMKDMLDAILAFSYEKAQHGDYEAYEGLKFYHCRTEGLASVLMFGRAFFLDSNMPEIPKNTERIKLIYRLSGLDNRDAISELREESDKYFTELEAERAKVAALQDRKFMRVLDARTVKGAPDKVPMEILSNSHAEKQHGGQSLDMLNARGGLSCLEIVANLRRVSPSSILSQVNDEMSVNEIKEAIKVHDQESNKVAYLEKRNAALVAALEKIYAADNDPAIELIAKNALAANEKGGKGE